jgi:type VI secretion system protein ImpE
MIRCDATQPGEQHFMSGTGETAGALFRAGNLAAAVEAGNNAVRKAPTDIAARMLLAEMLIFAGNLERADVVLDAASQLEPDAAVVVAEFRQLLRADMARRQLRRDGRVPEFLGEPTAPAMRRRRPSSLAWPKPGARAWRGRRAMPRSTISATPTTCAPAASRC